MNTAVIETPAAAPVAPAALATIPQAPHQAMAVRSGLPNDLFEMLGPVNKDDLIVIVKQARKADLTQKINVAVAKLAELEGHVTSLTQEFEAIGPDMAESINISEAEAAAKALRDAGFGKFKAAIKYGGRDDKARRYNFEVVITDRDDSSQWASDKHTKYVNKPFPAKAKTLVRQMALAKIKVRKQNTVLVALKDEATRLNDLAEATHAELATMIAQQTKQGRQVLERLLAIRTTAPASN